MNSILENIKIGTLVEIEVKNSDLEIIKLKTIVENISSSNELSIFAPILKGRIYPFRMNQTINLITIHKHSSDNQIEILTCKFKVTGKTRIDNIPTIAIFKTGKESKLQRRDFYRLPLVKNMTIMWNENKYSFLSKDLSGSGVRGFISNKIPLDAKCSLLLEINDKLTINLSLEVIDCTQDPEHKFRYDFRATFISLNSKTRTTLMKYIVSKQSETIRKQIELVEYTSLINSEQNYSDFFSMTNLEKIIRITPVLMWILILVQYYFLINAFLVNNFGYFIFFDKTRSAYSPAKLVMANNYAILSLALLVILSAIRFLFFKNNRDKYSISFVIQGLMSILTILLYINQIGN